MHTRLKQYCLTLSSLIINRSAESPLQWLRTSIENMSAMPRRQIGSNAETFGDRIARLRKARGLSQRDLASAVAVSQRVIAYYEGQTDQPPVQWLPRVAEVLGVGLDELLGFRRRPAAPAADLDVRLWRRLRKIQDLPPGARKAVLRVLDAYLANYTSDE